MEKTLKIIYDGPIDSLLDNALRMAAESQGWNWYAQGTEIESGKRDLAFIKDLDSFRLGIDPIPDWFMNKVSSNDIILRGEWRHLKEAEIMTPDGPVVKHRGDIITKDMFDGEDK